jgi:hypothetical protein
VIRSRKAATQPDDGIDIMHDLPRKLPIWPGAPSASSPRNHVLQQRGPDCAIAAAATITGVTYDQAASVAFSLREEGLGGMRPQAMVKLLYRLTDTPWRLELLFRTRIPLSSMLFPDQFVVVCIASHWRRRCHAIVARERVVYDGSLENPISTQDHPQKDWHVVWLIAQLGVRPTSC